MNWNWPVFFAALVSGAVNMAVGMYVGYKRGWRAGRRYESHAIFGLPK